MESSYCEILRGIARNAASVKSISLRAFAVGQSMPPTAALDPHYFPIYTSAGFAEIIQLAVESLLLKTGRMRAEREVWIGLRRNR